MTEFPYILEICAGSLASALAAEEAGANRVELCANLSLGGTTPSYGTLTQARELLSIPVFPIIRPRGGDFCYSRREFEGMIRDIILCRDLGFGGIACGILTTEKNVDLSRFGQLIELAWPMEVTFHRAFDHTADPMRALEEIISLGCQRLLTSGQAPTAFEGMALIRQLKDQAAERISIMPGSGIRSTNIAGLARGTGAMEFHSSGTLPPEKGSGKQLSPINLSPEDDPSIPIPETSRKEVVQLLEALRGLANLTKDAGK